MTILPPNATALERALDGTAATALDGVPAPLRDLWNPATCPIGLLPFLAWGVSVDFWDTNWTEAEKRAAVAGAIEAQRRKGTRASLREVLDRFDPSIGLTEWFEDKGNLEPHTFRIEMPLAGETDVQATSDLVEALLRDIRAVKPLRSHMTVVYRLVAEARTYLAAVAHAGGYAGHDAAVDLDAPNDPAWQNYLQTENGEPIRSAEGPFLEVA